MEEENLVKRIGDAYLNPNFVDGQVLLHTDMNEIVSVTKTAINENYNDIQRLQNGTISAGNANTVDSASVSRFADGELPDDDNKIPTAQQVKSFINSIDIGQSFELLEQIKEEIVDARGGEISLDARLDGIDSDINTINTNIEKISADVEINKTDIATNKSNISANASAIERLNTELNNTNETVSGISTALETTNANLDTTNTNIDNLTKSVSDLDAEVDGKQNTLTAGKNITIDGNEISATGGTGTWIGEDEPPADENYNMWVDPTEPLNNVGSEVVDSLEGNETDKAPSVRAVNEVNTYSTEEQVIGKWIDGKPLYRKVITGTKGDSVTQVNIGSITGVNEMIKMQGTLGSDSSGTGIAQSIGGYMDNRDNFSFIYFGYTDGSITLAAPASYKGKYIVILEYTKTTD